MDEQGGCGGLSEAELIAGLEGRWLPAAAFGHEAHVRAAWAYLQEGSLLAALGRFSAALRGFSAHHGAAERYHATITGAFVALIHERAARLPAGHSFAAFRAAYPELFADGAGVVGRYYRAETLASAAARAAFVAPDGEMVFGSCPSGQEDQVSRQGR